MMTDSGNRFPANVYPRTRRRKSCCERQRHGVAVVDDAGTDRRGSYPRRLLSALCVGVGADTLVTEVRHRDLPPSGADDSFVTRAFMKMQEAGYPALPVVDKLGRLVGLITAENVGEMMMIPLAPAQGRATFGGGPHMRKK